MRYAHHAARIFNTPLMISAPALDIFIAGCGHLFGLGGRPEAMSTRPARRTEDRRLRIAAGGVGIVDVDGVLTHRGRYAAESTYLLGYQDVARRLEAALDCDEVSSIVLGIDSPGGEAEGLFDLAARIRAASQIKPVHAVISGQGCSAAYLLAAAASEISITGTSHAGSIGVVYKHVDLSRALEMDGINVTYVYAGERKTWGNSAQPLSDQARERLQQDVDQLYSMFVATVAEYRDLSEDAIRATQADLFLGNAAIEAGLADRIETPDELLDRLAATNQEDPMFGRKTKTPATTATATATTATSPAPVDPEASPTPTEDPTAAGQLAAARRALETERVETRQLLAAARADRLQLEIERRLDALGTRVNLGMRGAGLPEALAAVAAADLTVAGNADATAEKPVLEVLFAALAAIPEFTAADGLEHAGAEADAGASRAADRRSTEARQIDDRAGIDDERASFLQAKYPDSFEDKVDDRVN